MRAGSSATTRLCGLVPLPNGGPLLAGSWPPDRGRLGCIVEEAADKAHRAQASPPGKRQAKPRCASRLASIEDIDAQGTAAGRTACSACSMAARAFWRAAGRPARPGSAGSLGRSASGA